MFDILDADSGGLLNVEELISGLMSMRGHVTKGATGCLFFQPICLLGRGLFFLNKEIQKNTILSSGQANLAPDSTWGTWQTWHYL